METSTLCYCVSSPNSFALPLAQSYSYTSPPPIARQILLPPFAFVFWISTVNRCLQPEWLYFMSCKLADKYSSATLSLTVSPLLPPFLRPA